MPTIVLPLDGSALAEAALPWAAFLARAHGLSLTLTRIATLGRRYTVDLAEDVHQQGVSAEWKEAAVYLGDIKQRLVADGLDVALEIRDGIASANILAVATHTKASAIVMSTHGAGGLRRVLVGSVADEVLRESTVPVVLIPSAAQRTPRLKTILVPLDGSRVAESALAESRKLGGEQATLTLVRVVAPIENVEDNGLFTEIGVDETATKASEVAASAYLRAVADRLGPNVAGDTRVLRGAPADQIASVAEAISADVIVMTTHGYSGIRRLRLGSVATDLIRRGSTPVMLITSRMLAAQAVGAQTIGEAMNADFVALVVDETVVSAARRMLAARLAVAPVVDNDGYVVGALSARDVLSLQAGQIAVSDGVAEVAGLHRARDTVAHVMKNEAVTIEETATLKHATETLLARGLDGMVVVRSGRPIGMIGIYDLLTATLHEPHHVTSSPSPVAGPSGAGLPQAPHP